MAFQRKILIIVNFFIALSFKSYCQNVYYYVPTQSSIICPNAEYQYDAVPGGIIVNAYNECSILDNFDWSVVGGTIVSNNNSFITVVWDSNNGFKSITLTTNYYIPVLPGPIQCVDAGSTFDHIETTYPTLVTLSISGSSNSTTYCSNSNINLTGVNGFSSYKWQYSIQTGVWNTFSTSLIPSHTFGIQDIFGAGYASYLRQNIFFRYSVDNCDPNQTASAPIGAYSFSANQIFATAISATKPTCAGGNDATVTITSLNRTLLASETLITTLYDTDALMSNPVKPAEMIPAGNVKGQANGLIVPNMESGTYHALIESNYGNCGLPKFVQVIVPSGPRTALSITTANVTSNFNGSQISCAGATDGQITINASGGSAPYLYSVDGSAFVSSNVFTNNLGSGSHSINIKDACTTPATASTTVTITPPNPVVVSSATPSLCNGPSNGQISIVAGGGTGTLSYSINDGLNYFSGQSIFTGLTPGTYKVKVKDLNNCTVNYGSVNIPTPVSVLSNSVSVTHPQCVGASATMGLLTISSVSGGTPGYNWQIFDLSNAPASSLVSVATPTNMAAGTYYAKVTDANGCPVNSAQFTVNAPISASYSSVNASCATVSDGSLTITAPTGGTNTYTYSINNGSFGTSNFFTGLATGSTYTLKVKDGNGCIFTINNAVVGLQSAITGITSQTAFINCNGQSTASITVAPSGGTAPYTSYSWSNGIGTQSNPNIPAGSYTVTITDSKTCTGTASIIITQPAALVVTPSSSNISCKGGSNGAINLVVTGGTGIKTFAWSNSATTQNLSGLATGTYSVTVKDANGCINNSTSVIITEPSTNVSVSLQSKSDVTCFGTSNGVILVAASGGTGTLTYSKDGTNFQASANFTGLAPGNYTITAKDANNCTQTTSAISIAQPSAALTISGIVKNNPLCNGNANGSLVVSATGGTSPYQYSIDGTTFSSSSTISGLLSGNYLVTVKDANSCTVISTSQSLVNPALLAATVTASPQSCAVVVDGRLTVSASGGTGTLQYSIDGTNFQTSSVFNGKLAGSYTVTIKDANNCSITRLATIATVAAIAGTITQTSFINCFGQSTAALNLSVTGGTAPFTYAWSNSATTQNISSLAVGSYSVTITDSKGCTGSTNFTVTQPILLTASTTPSNYNGFGVTCNGSSTGFINLTVAGGTSPFTYAWSNGATIKDIASLAAGTYTVTVTDSKGCTANASATLIAPTVVGISLNSKTNVTCNGGSDGSIVVNASGGTGTFNYSIDGVTWQSPNSFNSLTQGSYTLRARDQNNCVSPTPLAVSITQPSIISISFTGFVNANCGAADGAVQAVASGGTGVLSYQWKDQSNTVVGNTALLSSVISGSYTVTVTDQSSCSKSALTSVGSNGGAVFTVGSIVGVTCSTSTDGKAQVTISSGQGPFTVTWGNGETGLSATQLVGGSNTVSVKDANNCPVSSVFTVPSPIAISLSSIVKISPDCVGGNNGSIQVAATGGSGGYTYQWNGTSGTNILSGIASGTYSLQIKDSQNCPFSQSITLNDPPTIDIAIVNQVSPSCSSATDGSIQVLALGGSGGFSYSWNTGTAASSINSLAAGTYTVTVKDSKNCTQIKSISLVAATPLNVSVTASSTVSCFGGFNGSVTLSSLGGTGIYEYSVNGGSTWQTSATFSGLAAGALDIRTRDTNGCLGNASFSITQPTILSSSIGSVANTTCAQANGSATISGSEGTSPYSYQWFNSANQVVSSSNTLQSASAGTYQVITTDSKLCTTSNSVIIASSTNVSFNVTNVVATKCSTSADGSAQVSITSGKSPHTVQWSSGETSNTATKLNVGPNTVTVKDADGCSLQQTFSVASPPAISLISETIFAPLCAGGNGSIQVTVAGGTSPYSFQWNGQSGTGFNQNIKAGNYQLLVKDANGCTFNKSFTVADPTPYTIDLGPDKKICTGGVLAITSPVDASSYLWTSANGFSNTGKQVILTQAGSYKLRVTNNNGCTAEDTFVLTTSSDLLKADFLIAPVAHVGDTIIAIDISWPLPDRIGWTFPQEATVLVQSQDYASIVFKSEGKFPVKLTANLAECQSEFTTPIEILKKGETTNGGSTGNPLIKSLTAFPNPTSEDRINLKIELNEIAPVRIRLVSLEGNNIVTDFNGEDKDLYEYEIRLEGVAKGVYFLLVDVRNEKRVVRIVIV
ncbi:MAG: hypothetical protein ACKVOQ_20110 [Cyclobacteriaceae bacterium]